MIQARLFVPQNKHRLFQAEPRAERLVQKQAEF